jgi:hypothetical protein
MHGHFPYRVIRRQSARSSNSVGFYESRSVPCNAPGAWPNFTFSRRWALITKMGRWIACDGATVVVDDDGQPRSSGAPVFPNQKNAQLRMVCLPDGVRSCCLTPMNQIKAFALCFAAAMRESEKSRWDLTNEVINSAVVWHRLARRLGKMSNLSTDGSDRQGRSLKSKAFDRRLDLR